VIRLGAMGDVVRTLPAVAALRDHFPDARIDWLVEERTAPILQARGYIDEVVVFPRAELRSQLASGRFVSLARCSARFLRELRAKRYEVVFDFHAIARSALLGAASGSRIRFGYARPYGREGSPWLATHPVRLVRERVSRYERNQALVAAVGAVAGATAPLEVAPSARAAVRASLPVSDGRPFVVLHAGSSAAASHKRWPVARFAELAADLSRAAGLEDLRVLVAAGPHEAEQALAREIVRASVGAADLAPPTAHFEELAALLEAASALVAGDSGPLHVASLVGTPVVQILGPTDPVENEPWSRTPWRRVEVPLECRPCRRGCSAPACMRGVSAHAVARALRSVLSQSRRGSPELVRPVGQLAP